MGKRSHQPITSADSRLLGRLDTGLGNLDMLQDIQETLHLDTRVATGTSPHQCHESLQTGLAILVLVASIAGCSFLWLRVTVLHVGSYRGSGCMPGFRIVISTLSLLAHLEAKGCGPGTVSLALRSEVARIHGSCSLFSGSPRS